MKLRKLRYLTVEGLKNIWVNRLMSLASIGVLVACMLIMGVAVAFSQNVDSIIGTVEKQNIVMVYYEKDLDAERTAAINEKLLDIDNVSSARYIPKSDGLESLVDQMGEGYESLFTFYENDNPLPDASEVKFHDLEKFDQTIKKLEAVEGVASISHQREFAQKVLSIRRTVNIASTWIIVLLIIISLVIVSNTIRITMHSRKLEISIMKAVGATNGFIRFPFLVEGVVLGVAAAGLSTGLSYAVYRIVLNMTGDNIISGWSLIPFRSFALPLIGIFLFIGIVIGLIGSTIIITKYLNKEGSEFRAL